MKFIGFIKKFDPKNPFSVELKDYGSSNDLKSDELIKIIEYLKSGVSIWDWMEYWFDENDEPIGGAEYYSDGEWVWPLYYIYYLVKYKISVDHDFLAHCRKNDFKMAQIDNKQKMDLSKEFETIIFTRTPSR